MSEEQDDTGGTTDPLLGEDPKTAEGETELDLDQEQDCEHTNIHSDSTGSVLVGEGTPLPRFEDGFNMSSQVETIEEGIGKEPDQDSVDPEDPGAIELPPAIQNWPNVLAGAQPHISLFEMHLPPDKPEGLRYFQTFGLAEEMMHGRRHKFGLTRSIHLLKLVSTRSFLRYFEGSLSADKLADILVYHKLLTTSLNNQREPLLEAIDKYLCYSVMGEEGYLDQHIEEMQDLREDLSYDEIHANFARTRARLYHSIPKSIAEDPYKRETYEYVFERLEEIEGQYNRQVAETVADAALDILYLVKPIELSGYQSVSHDRIRLIDRFDAAITALEQIEIDLEDIDPDALRARIGENLDDPNESDAHDHRHPRELTLPLLDIPQTAEPEEAIRNKYEVILEAPTEMGQILNAAFRFTGNFGGAIYRIEQPDGTVTTNWKVNPLIADEPIDEDAILPGSNPFGADTYEELWEFTYVYEHFIEQLFTIAQASDDDSVECPLCEIAAEEFCHPDGCPIEPIKEGINEEITELEHHINVCADKYMAED
jgi:hypothetical protein